ncbi:MAG: hypothetical protein IT349_05615 [Candidatus Eisenbacteria bacterium]|nr:hypothetical protein [Candidatus Eisenbacteria bacterium]MCC7141564.1 hypothetical protein [Candidatus Eisenbacteria bacterium]
MSAPRLLAPFVSAVVVLVVVVVGVIRHYEALPQGPREVVWDHTPCAECRMSVSDRSYAAQMQLVDGRVLDFDDSGCLFRFAGRNDVGVHAIYYRHVREDRWLAEGEAAFIPAGPSPMGYDLGAVSTGTPDSEAAVDLRADFATGGLDAPGSSPDKDGQSHGH